MRSNVQHKIEPDHVELAFPQIVIALNPLGIASMTRDMELIRRILLEIKSRKNAKPRQVSLDGIEQSTLLRHVEMLCRSGFVETQGDIHYSSMIGEPDMILVTDMSWAGHDFLAVLENEGVWNKLKSSISPANLASMPLDVMKTVGVGLLTKWAMGEVGLG